MESETRFKRRKFLGRCCRMAAAVAGLSLLDLRKLLAQELKQLKPAQKPQQLQSYNVLRKSAAQEIKLLKVMVENSRQVFENEFGRQAPIRTGRIEQMLPTNLVQPNLVGNMVADCPVNFGVSGDQFTTGLICSGENFCSGQGLGDGGCNTNECNGQTCDAHACGHNDCDQQGCSLFEFCDRRNSTSLVDLQVLERHRSDPYIVHLLDRFNVTTTQALARQLNVMFRNARANMR